MMSKTYIGIDNGVSGTIGIITKDEVCNFCKTPVKNVNNYQKPAKRKKKVKPGMKPGTEPKVKPGLVQKKLNRIDHEELALLIGYLGDDTLAIIERPMVNATRFNASLSAVRALEATLVVLEELEIPYIFCDSREWQKVMLPAGTKGDALKTESKRVGNELFPQFADVKHPDRDGILIAEYARRMKL